MAASAPGKQVVASATGPWGSVACVSSGVPLPQVGRGLTPGLGSFLCWMLAFSRGPGGCLASTGTPLLPWALLRGLSKGEEEGRCRKCCYLDS